MAKVMISVSDDLLKKIDTYAEATYTSRSGLITLCMVEYLKNKEVPVNVPDEE